MTKTKKPTTSTNSSKANTIKISIVSILLLVGLFILTFQYYYSQRIYPNILVADVNVGGKTKNKALEMLKYEVQTPQTINLKAKESDFQLSLSEIDFNYEMEKSVNLAFNVYRNENFVKNLGNQMFSFASYKNIPLEVSVNEQKVEEFAAIVSSQVADIPVPPTITITNGQVVVEKGAAGETINNSAFKNILLSNLSQRNYLEINIPFTRDDTSLSDSEVEIVKSRAEKLKDKTLVLENEFNTITINSSELITFLDGKGRYQQKELGKFIDTKITTQVNREPQNAVFRFEEGKVVEFKAAKNGLTLNRAALLNNLETELALLELNEEKNTKIKIPVESKSPEVTTDKVNDLGIKELIGRGTSTFKGSIPGRIYNVGHASAKFNGLLVPPGADFSFNQALGDVSTLTGYKQAYVIRDGKTVLGDGGGVCQVSTTLFRAVLKAGLPITERRAHSYRVGYYEQDTGPGLDATVFSPTTDFKFKNDTPGHLLIQTEFDGKNQTLVFEIYGTSDGRVATTTKPIVLSSTKPPDDQYIDDPSLPAGQVRQIEHRATGARVSFDHKVERNGEVIFEKQFLSAYRPWGAVFMKGTGSVN